MFFKAALRTSTALALCVSATAAFAESHAPTITIATVNNGDMIRMQGYTDQFTEETGINVEWVTLEENVLRQRVTTDITTNGGQFDIMTIGMYETPIWGANGWLVPLDGLSEEYNVDDLLPAMRAGLSHDGTLYAAPFYGESSMIMYRTDLMDAAGLEMPEAPTWQFIREAAAAMDDPENGVNGICLRGKPGWGEGGAFITVTGNSFGARWFDEDWNAQFDQPEWAEALNFYVSLMNDYGPDGYENNGFTENLNLFNQGLCGMWIDATVAASFVSDPKASKVADKVGYALAPDNGLGKRGNWLWAWSLAIPAGTKKADAAEKFVSWATSKHYAELVASKEGWANVPPGTRSSLYANADYQKAAPFAKMTLDSINAADPTHPTVKPVPYVGVQFVAIPEFQGLGTTVGQLFSAALAGQSSVDDALKQAQDAATAAMTEGGYIK